MTANEWLGCDRLESVPDKVSGAVVFKDTRLPVDTVVDNVDAYMDEGLSLDEAISETLESFPTVPECSKGIRAVLEYRAEHEPQFQS